MCELLNTVKLLKSEFINAIIKLKKLTITKNNCKNVREKILLSKFPVSLSFKLLRESTMIKNEHPSPKSNE